MKESMVPYGFFSRKMKFRVPPRSLSNRSLTQQILVLKIKMCILNQTKFILKCNLNFVCVQKKVIYTPKKLIAVMSGD